MTRKPKTKVCFNCGLELPISAFDLFHGKKGHYKAACKVCTHISNEPSRKRNENSGAYIRNHWGYCLDYFNHRCAACGALFTERLAAKDHWIPVVDGGKWEVGNIVPLCFQCNSSKNGHEPFEWLARKFGAEDGLKIALRVLAYFGKVTLP